jgi:hypothetical protein
MYATGPQLALASSVDPRGWRSHDAAAPLGLASGRTGVGILAETRKSVNGARGFVLLVAVLAQPLVVVSIAPQTNEASTALQQFLAAELIDHAYRTTRCLTAEIGSRRGWLWASTRTDPHHGFSYSVIAEGGSGFIRGRVLHPLLEAERKLVADHGQDNAAFSRANYEFHIQDR